MLGWGGKFGAALCRRCVVAGATALVVFTIAPVAQASSPDEGAPVHAAGSAGIAGQYIVVLKGGLPIHPTERSEQAAAAEDARVASLVKATPLFVYDADIKGFAADLTDAQLTLLRHSPDVAYVEQDARVEEQATPVEITQTGATWGLARIDERALDIDGLYSYSSTAGAGVHVYILDTGVLANHNEFQSALGSRASNTYDAIGGVGSGSDCNGHGTHVAGTVGGRTYGVAKLATLVGVRVIDCAGFGTSSGIIAGVNWVTENHVPNKSVANMSLGGAKSTAMNDAVSHLVESGVFVSVAAGNSNTDACNVSPASAPGAFTTAASDIQDSKAAFSNWGPCVGAWAPGKSITSAWIGSSSATNTISGTSMAAPHVAGTAALYLADHVSTPAGTAAWIRDHATTGLILNGNIGGTPDRLLYKADL